MEAVPPPPPDSKEYDEWHKKKQAELRSKRKAATKTEEHLAKEKKRKEHIQKTLAAQRKGGGTSLSTPQTKGGVDATTNVSAFQSLFAKRAEGFEIHLKFRSIPPRPPVGPTFVGLGLKGELTTKWTEYRPGNAIELNHTWKLHNEPDLGVSLGMFAMDWNGCYKVPKRAKLLQDQQQQQKNKKDNLLNAVTDEDEEGCDPSSKRDKLDLHPDDAELLHWTGSMGDTAAEELKARRERARAMALLGSQGMDVAPNKKSQVSIIKLKEEDGGRKRQKFSRVLDEDIQSWMKKTTYLTNDQYRSVHQFKSLADTKKETADAVDKSYKELTESKLDPSSIDESFEFATNDRSILVHPSKRDVTIVSDYPLLPDVSTWGHIFTHVVLDNAPKALYSTPAPSEDQLARSFIGDVEKKENSGMICNFLVPTGEEEEEEYDVAQLYDLDVFPIQEEDQPQTTFVISIDEEKGIASYHPISSRVNLTSGRPRGGHVTIKKRPLDDDEIEEFEKTTAEIDEDLAEKYLR
mmetsp:Transcript_23844/g.34182  ORF Transcript_23844/g.34182 Transcript_23844/m.34182 type:complete len:520 (+) Transcript_23844:201-1760(+)|eukprot:CAMPEP_0172437604 /NCGR_PEP_ID=MMETSP1064-20121228/72350_1 /TAXON_ID=202472 /ORGANISM="Aulacoseira subarctica , Strain CCAP 1002/5" /LENGTH=519 /DNA_ID=CAMNT_0013186095 /DNA_START=116 /DNA_END=1675 /DNA_ORIENTATION=-